MTRVVVNIPDSVDLSKVNDMKLCIRYHKNNNEYSYVTDGFSIEERPKGDWIINPDTRTMKCSRCGAIENADRWLVEDMNYCHCCGTDMRKGNEE